jgi:hypothetical protein
MATCICGNWIRNPTYTADARYDSMCNECKGYDSEYPAPTGEDLLELTIDDYNKNLYDTRC